MKIYQYFVNDKNLQHTKDDINEKYPLYAITTKKIYSEIFEISRNMNKFIKKVYKGNGDDSSVISYLNKHRGNVLDYYELDTIGSDKSHSKKVQVLMTDIEYANVEHITENSLIIEEMRWIPPDIFSKNISKHLDNINYGLLYWGAVLTEEEICILYEKVMGKRRKIKDFPQIEYDELRLFVELNLDTLSTDFREAISPVD